MSMVKVLVNWWSGEDMAEFSPVVFIRALTLSTRQERHPPLGKSMKMEEDFGSLGCSAVHLNGRSFFFKLYKR